MKKVKVVSVEKEGEIKNQDCYLAFDIFFFIDTVNKSPTLYKLPGVVTLTLFTALSIVTISSVVRVICKSLPEPPGPS